MDENHDILEDASNAILSHMDTRGGMSRVYERAAKIANAILGFDAPSTFSEGCLDGEDIIKILIAVKLARDAGNSKDADNLVDIAGYCQGIQECRRSRFAAERVTNAAT
jgi:hypothetical protein